MRISLPVKITALLTLLGFGVFIDFYKPHVKINTVPDTLSSSSPMQAKEPLKAPNPNPSSSGMPFAIHPERANHWKAFQKRFGRSLKPEFSRTGHLVSIKGDWGQGNPAGSDFKPDDPKKAIYRAREILSAASDLIGIQSTWPLENALARGSQISAQVFFSQMHEGTLIAPVGNVKIDLGTRGELLGLYSDYAPSVMISNQVRLDPDEAQQKVIAAFQNSENTALTVEGGSKVIWVSGEKGRYAYQFIAQGHYQVVVDAESGQVIHTKDIRQH